MLLSYLRLDLPRGIFPEYLPAKILNDVMLSSFLATWHSLLNLQDSITLLAEWQSMKFSPLHILIPLGSE